MARPSNRSVVMGFHPGRSDIRFDLVTPLLLANVLRWFEPDVFRAYDLHGGSAGTVTATLDNDGDPSTSKCSEIRSNCPSRSKAGRCGFLRAHRRRCASSVAAGSRCTPYLCRRSRPQVGSRPDPPSVDCPARSNEQSLGILWQYLAVLGAIGLLVEWLVYGRARTRAVAPSATRATPAEMRQAS